MSAPRPPFNTLFLAIFAGVVMAYGWGYRGIVGHEGGAALAGAMLGLAVCLAVPRPDWHRRAAVAGLCAAVGWSWGGSLSYMEQTFYTVSASFVDTYYGYAMLFLFGALWAGIGGAVLGLAFTLPRSELQRLTNPFLAITTAYFLTYLYGLVFPQQMDRFHDFTAVHFHDGDWFPALTALVIGLIYMVVRPKERAEAGLFVACAIGWWIGYLGFTKFGGISLGPPYRSESWGGVVGILVVLILWLIRNQNRAALMLCLYGTVGGGLAFAAAVFIRHPLRVGWGPFASWGGMMQWKVAEESFGLLMGIAIALGIARLYRGGLQPPAEDAPRRPLDIIAAFVMLVALMWMNLRRVPERWFDRYAIVDVTHAVLGMTPWTWVTLGGIILTAIVVYGLYLYSKDALFVTPSTAFGKGAMLLLLVMWVTVWGGLLQSLPGAQTESFPLVDATFIGLSAIATLMLFSRAAWANLPEIAPASPASPADLRWRVGLPHTAVWVLAPLALAVFTYGSIAMQPDGAAPGHRLRFGDEAYWREASLILGKWEVKGTAPSIGGEAAESGALDFSAIDFQRTRNVVRTMADGTQEAAFHRWRHADSVIWLDWYARVEGDSRQKELPMRIEDGRLYIPWPPDGSGSGYVVLERLEGN